MDDKRHWRRDRDFLLVSTDVRSTAKGERGRLPKTFVAIVIYILTLIQSISSLGTKYHGKK